MKGQYQELWNIYTFLILLHIFQNSSPVTTAFSSQDELQMNWTQLRKNLQMSTAETEDWLLLFDPRLICMTTLAVPDPTDLRSTGKFFLMSDTPE